MQNREKRSQILFGNVSVQYRPILKGFLPQLIPVLLRNMAYDENDEDVINAEAAESHADCPDRDQDIKPFIMQKVSVNTIPPII